MKDIITITDSVAEPERLDPAWISKALRPEEDEVAQRYAHAGIEAAAHAVLKACAHLLPILQWKEIFIAKDEALLCH